MLLVDRQLLQVLVEMARSYTRQQNLGAGTVGAFAVHAGDQVLAGDDHACHGKPGYGGRP